jgi:hypothetical protein
MLSTVKAWQIGFFIVLPSKVGTAQLVSEMDIHREANGH